MQLLIIPLLMTAYFTAAICRYRIAREKPIGMGTAWLGALGTPLFMAFIGTCIDPYFWSWNDAKGPGTSLMLILFGLLTAISVLPSGLVVSHYQKLRKKEKTHTV